MTPPHSIHILKIRHIYIYIYIYMNARFTTFWVTHLLILSKCVGMSWNINTLRPGQNGRHFADAIFKCILLNENVWISIKISLKFVRKGPINNIPTLVQIMAWRRPGAKPLSEPMMVRLPTHICVTRPQWVNKSEVKRANGLGWKLLQKRCMYISCS